MSKIALFAMTQKGFAVAETLLSQFPHIVSFVVSSPDKNIKKDFYNEIIQLCKEKKVPFFHRRNSFTVTSEYIIAVSWRWLINSDSAKIIAFHDSLLPKYRGFNPLVTALINGDKEIGVTALFASQDYDRGEIISQSKTSISYPIRIQQAIEKIIINYRELTLSLAQAIENSCSISSHSQNEEIATYSLWRDEEDYFINWNYSAEKIKRFVDAVGFPYKGAASHFDDKIVRILDVDVLDDVTIENRIPGKVIFRQENFPIVVCGKGLLKINKLTDDICSRSLLPLPRFRIRFL